MKTLLLILVSLSSINVFASSECTISVKAVYKNGTKIESWISEQSSFFAEDAKECFKMAKEKLEVLSPTSRYRVESGSIFNRVSRTIKAYKFVEYSYDAVDYDGGLFDKKGRIQKLDSPMKMNTIFGRNGEILLN